TKPSWRSSATESTSWSSAWPPWNAATTQQTHRSLKASRDRSARGLPRAPDVRFSAGTIIVCRWGLPMTRTAHDHGRAIDETALTPRSCRARRLDLAEEPVAGVAEAGHD